MPGTSPGLFALTPQENQAFARVSKRQLFDAAIVLMARTKGVSKPDKLWAENGGGEVEGGTRRWGHIEKVMQLIAEHKRNRQ